MKKSYFIRESTEDTKAACAPNAPLHLCVLCALCGKILFRFMAGLPEVAVGGYRVSARSSSFFFLMWLK